MSSQFSMIIVRFKEKNKLRLLYYMLRKSRNIIISLYGIFQSTITIFIINMLVLSSLVYCHGPDVPTLRFMATVTLVTNKSIYV
jgi:hypothetical protein